MKDLIKLKQITRHFVNKCNKIPGHGIRNTILAIDYLTQCIEKVDNLVKNSSIGIDKMNKKIPE